MNIKQAEQASGVSKRNIRFYEQEKLIAPKRNRDNDYREYSQEDIAVLKQIRMLRMVDMPLEQIRQILQGKTELKDAAHEQKEKLQQKARELEAAIRFCDEFAAASKMEALDTDAVLRRMEAPENRGNLFTQWVEDYKRLAKAQAKKTYTFYPDNPVQNPGELTMALFQFADSCGLDMVITKEGMRPEMTINGHEYKAEVFYTVVQSFPVTGVQCRAVHPEEFEPEDIPDGRRRVLRLLYWSVPFVLMLVFVLMLLLIPGIPWWAWLAMAASFLTVLGLRLWRGVPLASYWRPNYPESKQEDGKKKPHSKDRDEA